MDNHGWTLESPLSHVVDHDTLELPWWSPPDVRAGDPPPEIGGVQITRFMVMELIAAVLMLADPGPGGPAHRARTASAAAGS